MITRPCSELSQERLLHATLPLSSLTLTQSYLHDHAFAGLRRIPVTSYAVVMASPTEIHDGGKDSSAGLQDVFHTPPEESSPHYSSDEQQPAVAADADHCAVNQAGEVDGGSQAFVELCGYSDGAEFADLGKDSDLGFSEGEVVDPETVAHVEGDGAGQDLECKVDEIRILERDLHCSGEFLAKKLKHSEQDLGFGSSGDFLGVESTNAKEGLGNCKGKLASDAEPETPCDFGADIELQENVLEGENCCREVSVDKNLGSGENLETQFVHTEIKESAQAGKFPCAAENKSSHEVVEASRAKEKNDDKPKGRVLPPSFRVILDDEAKRSESEEGEKKEESCAFKVLKYLSENFDEDEDLENINWVEVLKRSGVTFPRPRWWPEHYESTSGLVLERYYRV